MISGPDRRGAAGLVVLPVLVGLAVGGLMVWLLLCHGKAPEIPVETQARIDSLQATNAEYKALAGAREDTVRTFRDSLGTTTAAVVRLKQSAARSGHRSDSLAALAAHADSVPADSAAAYYRGAYQERTVEADSLRTAVGLQFHAMRDAMLVANVCLRAQADAEGRMSQMQGVQDTLRAVIARSKQPSHWSVGVTAGYGAMFSSGQVHTGPSVSAGVTYSVRLPHLF